MKRFYKKDLNSNEATELLNEGKIHMFIVTADKAKISEEAMVARVSQAFEDLINAGQIFHSWFVK